MKEKARERDGQGGRVQLVDLLSTRRQFAVESAGSDIEYVIYVPCDYEHFAVTLDIYSLFLFHFPPLRFMCHCFGV